MRKFKHFLIRNVWRDWPSRIVFAVTFLWVEIFLILIINLWQSWPNFDINFISQLFLSQIQSLEIWLSYISALIVFNICFTFRKVNVTQILFLASLSLTNLAGLVFFLMYNYNWNFVLTNVLVLINFVLTLFSIQEVLIKEHGFMKQIFGRYIHPEVMENILSRPEKLELGGEQKNLTVMFCDLRGFTVMAESTSPTRLVEILNSYFDQMSKIVIDNRGTIDKYIGDCIMAFWGAPISDAKHSRQALQAALSMIDKVSQIQNQYPEFSKLDLGIGLHSGPMIVGNLGSQNRFDYTVLGDNVNLGARLEALTKRYKVPILISENVYNESGSFFEKIVFRLVDEILVKGKSTAVKIYQPMTRNERNLQIKKIYENSFFFYQRGDFVKALDELEFLVDQKDWPSIMLFKRIEKIINEGAKFNPVWNWNEDLA